MKRVRVIWTDESLSDLEIIHDFIAENSLKAAKKVIQSILARTRQLETFPESGSSQETDETGSRSYRYLVEGYFKIIYSLDDKVLYVEAIIDTRQNPNSHRQ